MRYLVLTISLAFVVGCAQAKGLAGKAGVDEKDMNKAASEAKSAADDAPKDIYTLAGYKGFSQLTAALGHAGLDRTLQGPGPFTVFAPTDEAFNKIPAEKRAELMSDAGKEKLKQILTYHVVSGKVGSADVVKMTSAKTVNGADIAIAATGGKVMVNSANVTATDVEATNGVIHVIDSVLIPPGM